MGFFGRSNEAPKQERKLVVNAQPDANPEDLEFVAVTIFIQKDGKYQVRGEKGLTKAQALNRARVALEEDLKQ